MRSRSDAFGVAGNLKRGKRRLRRMAHGAIPFRQPKKPTPVFRTPSLMPRAALGHTAQQKKITQKHT